MTPAAIAAIIVGIVLRAMARSENATISSIGSKVGLVLLGFGLIVVILLLTGVLKQAS